MEEHTDGGTGKCRVPQGELPSQQDASIRTSRFEEHECGYLKISHLHVQITSLQSHADLCEKRACAADGSNLNCESRGIMIGEMKQRLQFTCQGCDGFRAQRQAL